MSLVHAATPFDTASPDPASAFFGADPVRGAMRVAALQSRPTPAVRGELSLQLPLRHAGLHGVRVRFEVQGAPGLPLVLVAGGISADRHVGASAAFPDAGWWDVQVGAGQALDPARHRVLAIDYLGADGLLDVPIDAADQADAIAAVLDHLGVARAVAFIGSSYGAMVGLHFAIRHPARIGHLVAISGAHRAHPYAAAWRSLQRRALALGQLQCADDAGLALARQFAMLSYRTPEEFAERFDAAPVFVGGRLRCASEDYLDAAADRYVARVSPTAFLRLSESIDLHRVAPEDVRVPTTVIAVEQDRLVPISDAYALVEGLGANGQLRVVRSPFGHDAFLKEATVIGALLSAALAQPLPAAAASATAASHASIRAPAPSPTPIQVTASGDVA